MEGVSDELFSFATVSLIPVSLPDEFTSLLKLDTNNSNFSIYTYLLENKQLASLLDFTLPNFDWRHDSESLLNSMGWINLRNSIAASYVHYSLYGHFGDSASVEIISDMIVLENKLTKFVVNGFSRAFLLALYIKEATTSDTKNGIEIEKTFFIQDEVIGLLSFAKAKIIKIDWALITLSHFSRYLGIKTLTDLLSKKVDYFKIFNLLPDFQKEEMISNCLAYGHSISEADIFSENMV